MNLANPKDKKFHDKKGHQLKKQKAHWRDKINKIIVLSLSFPLCHYSISANMISRFQSEWPKSDDSFYYFT